MLVAIDEKLKFCRFLKVSNIKPIEIYEFRSIYMWASAATDCTVTLWDTRQHPANVLVRRFDRSTNCLCYSPNDAFIALGSDCVYLMDPRVKEYRSLPSSSQVS